MSLDVLNLNSDEFLWYLNVGAQYHETARIGFAICMLLLLVGTIGMNGPRLLSGLLTFVLAVALGIVAFEMMPLIVIMIGVAGLILVCLLLRSHSRA